MWPIIFFKYEKLLKFCSKGVLKFFRGRTPPHLNRCLSRFGTCNFINYALINLSEQLWKIRQALLTQNHSNSYEKNRATCFVVVLFTPTCFLRLNLRLRSMGWQSNYLFSSARRSNLEFSQPIALTVMHNVMMRKQQEIERNRTRDRSTYRKSECASHLRESKRESVRVREIEGVWEWESALEKGERDEGT